MRYGIIYYLVERLFTLLCWLSPSQWFKWIAMGILRLQKKNDDFAKSLLYKRFAVDSYILLKWLFLLLACRYRLTDRFSVSIVCYLIFMNVFVFFHTLVWQCPKGPLDDHWSRRRFLHLLQAICFSYVSFAYLYSYPVVQELSWGTTPLAHPIFLHAFWFSLSNSVAGNYDLVKPRTDTGNNIAMIQFMCSFVFVTIVIGRALPLNTQSDPKNTHVEQRRG